MKNTLKQIMFENENEFSFDYEYDNVKDIFSAFRKLAFNVNKYGIDIKALLEKMSCDISNNLKNNIEDNFDCDTEVYHMKYTYEKDIEFHYYFYDKENGIIINCIVEYNEDFSNAYMSLSYTEKAKKTYTSIIQENNVTVINENTHEMNYDIMNILKENTCNYGKYLKMVLSLYDYRYNQKIDNDLYKLEIIVNDDYYDLIFIDRLNNIFVHYHYDLLENGIKAYSLFMTDNKGNNFDVLSLLPYEIKIA